MTAMKSLLGANFKVQSPKAPSSSNTPAITGKQTIDDDDDDDQTTRKGKKNTMSPEKARALNEANNEFYNLCKENPQQKIFIILGGYGVFRQALLNRGKPLALEIASSGNAN